MSTNLNNLMNHFTLYLDSLNGKILPKISKIFFIDENFKSVYTIKNDDFNPLDDSNISYVKNCILLDSVVELKTINVPIVSRTLLNNIVLNTIKKFSTSTINKDNIDYKILGKDEKQYELLVFIRNANLEDLVSRKKIFTVYHVLENLMKDKYFPDDTSFIVNNNNIWFLYTFVNRRFKRRDIYFPDDLKNLKSHNIYYLKIFSDGNEQPITSMMQAIPEDKKRYALETLHNNIYKPIMTLSPRTFLLGFAVAAILFLVIFLQVLKIRSDTKKDQAITMNKNLEQQFKDEKQKRGISDEIYNEYIKIMSKKSRVNEFFYYLNQTGKNNIEIQKLNYEDKKFSLSGYCLNDSRLEDEFRKLDYWKQVNISFSRKPNKISFTISGEFNYE